MGTRVRRALAAVVLTLAAAHWWCRPALAQDPAARTVLTIHWGAEDYPGTSTLDTAIRDGLRSTSAAPINYYAEYLETEVFPPETAALALRDYIARKFEGRRIDVVIANTSVALDFVLAHRATLFPATPIVFAAGSMPASIADHRVTNVTGVVTDVVFAETVDLALRLHPSTRRVFVVAQAPALYGYDRRVRTALERFAGRVELTFVPQQSFPGLLATVRGVPSNSVILFTRYIPDDVDSNIYADEVARRVAEVTPVPM